MRRKIWYSAAIFLAVGLLASGCQADPGGKEETEIQTETQIELETGDKTEEKTESETKAGFSPVYADSLKDGDYQIQVNSSSNMFHITECTLTVKDGTMSAVMTMGGTGYLKVFMGTGSEAEKASEESFIPFKETAEGTHTFQIPVEALDMEIDCAAFSRRKEKWYDRVLVFQSESLPAEAFARESTTGTSVESMELEEGTYTVEVSLEGGSGRMSVQSPARLLVKDKKAYAVIVWESENYDYMKVDGEQYDRIHTDGNSEFEIPVSDFDRKVPVIANTIAMSVPHEIDYTLYFDSGTLKREP